MIVVNNNAVLALMVRILSNNAFVLPLPLCIDAYMKSYCLENSFDVINKILVTELLEKGKTRI